MNTPRRIRTVVIEVPVDNDWLTQDGAAHGSAARPRFKPSDLVPWSDPYIAGLVRKLQTEVRDETQQDAREGSTLTAEAEMPWNEPFEYDTDDTGFHIDTDALLNR